MATLVSQRVTEDGKIAATTTLDATNNFLNTGAEFIFFENRSGSTKTITVTTQVTSIRSPLYGDIVKNDATISVANGEIAMIGPFPVEAYNDDEGLTIFAITPSALTDKAGVFYL